MTHVDEIYADLGALARVPRWMKFRDMRIDAIQGTTDGDRAFGFVALHAADREYQGWFFTWPSSVTRIERKQIETVLDTLEPDDTSDHLPRIPARWARRLLKSFLLTQIAPHE